MSESTYQGSCFCGAVKLTVSGALATSLPNTRAWA